MAKINKTDIVCIYKKPRGWGYELWIENLPDYCGKLLFIKSGKQGSMHFHMNKLETMYLQSGQVQLGLIDSDDGTEYNINLYPGESIKIPRGQVHQIRAITDSELFEFSTMHEESDSHRIKKGD